MRAATFMMVAMVWGGSVSAAAEYEPLTAEGLLLVYNANSAPSRELAEYYAKVRGVPEDRLLGLPLQGMAEEIDRAGFEDQLHEPIRQYLREKKLREQVRCLVTFYGLPIRVGGIKLSREQQARAKDIRQDLVKVLDQFERALDELEHLGATSQPAPKAKPPRIEDQNKLMERYARLKPATWQRVAQLSDGQAAAAQRQELLRLTETIEGLAGVVRTIAPLKDQQSAQTQRWMEEAAQAVRQMDEQVRRLTERGPEDAVARSEAGRVLLRSHGLIGQMSLLRSDLNQLTTEETQASVDSELTLLWWDGYPKHRWVMNTLSWEVRRKQGSEGLPERLLNAPVLMVSRLDGPSPGVVRRMIDDALAAEKKGLDGIAYFDARGLKRKDEGYYEYDVSLRSAAQMLWNHTKLRVRLDTRPGVFEAGKCPDAMLYCGWYSLRNYVDAFDFVPGAVAYHLASFEAISIRDPHERGWVKNLLEDGVAATIGPVAEPYLQAYPSPEEFFGLLLTGRFTLAECYAYTTRFNSWMMMLLGDPLYRPFAANPLLKLEDVFDEPGEIPPGFGTAASGPAQNSKREDEDS